MTRWLIPVLLAAAVLLPGQSSGQPDEQLLADVRAAWEARQQATKSVKVSWTAKDTTPKGALGILFDFHPGFKGKVVPPADVTHPIKATLLFDDTQSRFTIERMAWNEPTSQFQPHAEDAAFRDGTVTTLYRMDPQPWPTGTINKANRNMTAGDISAWPVRAAFRGPVTNISGIDLAHFSTARRTTLAGHSMIELVRQRTETRGEAKVWVDPAQDYAPYRYDSYARNGELIHRITATSRKDPSGLWVPTSWTVVVYEQKKLVRAVEATIRELVINLPTSPEDFKITFPPGTIVYDQTGPQPREHIVREGGDRRDVLPEERGASYEDLIRTEAGDLAPGGRSSFVSRNRTWVIAVGGSLVVAAVAVLVFRRVRWGRPAGGGPSSPVPSPEVPK